MSALAAKPSKMGQARGVISDKAVNGTVFLPFHFHDCANRLTLGLLDRRMQPRMGGNGKGRQPIREGLEHGNGLIDALELERA